MNIKPSLLFALLAAPLAAADVNGTVTGTVTDPAGALVPGVEVTVTNTGTNASWKAATDAAGVYSFRTLPVGSYNVTVLARGFKKAEQRNIRLQVNEIARVDVALAIGETVETVTVEANVVTVDTTTATLKTVVDKKRIEELPLNGRNPTQLMRLVAGVQADFRADVTSGTTYPGVTPVSVNGSRANQTNYVLDGAQNNDHYSNAPNPMPNPDALQEFSVQTNNFSAEFGRNSGGIVNAVTRSGTNQFHGVAFEYVRNKALNAANFFNPIVNGVKRDDGLKRNQYGFTAGGPVLLPKIYDGRDKSFFFFSYQKTALRQAPAAASRIVPTAAQKRGDFSGLLPRQQLRDPFGNVPYPNNQIPLSQFNPIARTIADSYLPLPQSGNTVSFQVPTRFDDDQVLVRGDQQLGSRHRLSGRYWKSWAAQPAFLDRANYLASVGGRDWNNWSTIITDTHTVSPTLINTILFSRNYTDGPVVQVGPEKSLTALGVKMFNDDKPQYHMTINGYFQINTGDTNNFFRDEYQFSDTARWTRGRHNISFGGEYGYGIGDIVNNFRANGQFQWNGAAPFTTDALADYFVGKFSQLTQGIGEYKTNRFHIFALHFQDSMKLSRRFTLDLGLRWDPFFPYTDTLGRLSSWRPGQQSTRYPNAPRGVLYPGDPGLPDGGYNTAWNNLGPRLGFAWDVFGNGRTSLRGGYGVFFDRSNTISTNSQANQGPFGTILTVFGNNTNTFTDPYAGTSNPFPASQNPPRDVRFVLPHTAFVYEEHMRNANLQAWNLTLEREVAGGFVARVAYAGSKGTRLVSLREENAAVFTPGATTATTNQRRPLFPNFGNVTLIEPVGNSTFHSMQLTAERRFSKGFSILANYMWSKSIDDGSANKATGQTHANPFNLRYSKGLSDFDHAHVFTFSSLWQLPVRFDARLANTLLGGWNLTSIATLQSGFPFTVGSGADNARTGTGGQRADLIGNPYLAEGRSRGERILQWLNPAAFQLNAIGTFGNLGRNTFRGPGLATTDFGLHKSFPISERIRTEFRFEVFNAFNRVNLTGPDGNRSSGNFLRTTAAFDPRILQLALRVAW
jgi:hypothetical protein